MGKWTPEPESSSDLDPDLEADQALAAAELVCGVCGTTINVNRYGKPYLVIRCIAHDPRYFGGTDATATEKENSADGGGE